MPRIGLGLVALLLCAVAPIGANAQDRVIVFGDSLSDTGNLNNLFFTPDPPYNDYHASNGLVWSELLFGTMNSPVQGTGVAGNVDMAYYGARTDSGAIAATHVPGAVGVPDQIVDFGAAGGVIDPTDIVVVWAGANNIRECIQAAGFCTTAADVQANAEAAANSQVANVGTLIGLGAQTILVPGAQNLGAAPLFPNAADQLAALASANAFNATLYSGLSTLASSAPPGTNIIYADMDALGNVIFANPGAFGITNTTDPCISGFDPFGPPGPTTVCGNPNAYYFWDVIHPTETVHALFAKYLGLLLDTTPAIIDTAPLGESLQKSSDLVTNAVFDRLSYWFSGVYVKKNGPYAELLGQLGRYSSDGKRPAFDLDLGGTRLGWDQRMDSGVLGASVAVLGGNQSSQNLSSDIQSVRGDVYGTYVAGPAYAGFDFGLGKYWFDDVTRATGIGPVVATSDMQGYVATASAEAGIAHRLGGVVLVPSVRLSYIHSRLDGYQEQAPLLALAFEDQSSDGVLGRVNLRAVSNQDLGGVPIALSAEVGYSEYVSFSGSDITAVLANNTALPATAFPGDPSGPGFLGKVGLSSQISAGMYIDMNYGISVQESGGETHTGSLRLKANM